MNLTARDIDLIKGEPSRRSLETFIKTFWPICEPSYPFQDGIQIQAICEHLTHLAEIRNLLVCMPPRLGKSTLISVLWFCWHWLHFPASRFVYSSYALKLSERDSLKCRDVITSNLYQRYYSHLFKLSEDQNTKVRFENNKRGVRLAISVDGSATGEGGDIIVADDPMNLAHVESKAERESVINWYNQVYTNRLNNPATGCRIVVMQRGHREDLAGNILANDEAKNWCKLILPLEYKPDKVIVSKLPWRDPRTEEGELLCPVRIPPVEVAYLKGRMGKRGFNAQYNQAPTSSEEAIFRIEDFRYYDALPETRALRIAAVDLAISEKETADYTACVVADFTDDGNCYIVHLLRQRIKGVSIVPTLEEIYHTYKPSYMMIEDVAFQRLVIQELRQRNVPAIGVKPEGDKVSRTIPLQIKLEGGKVLLPKDKDWTKVLLDEVGEFPGCPHDDQVDAIAYVIAEGNRRVRVKPVEAIVPVNREEEARKMFNAMMMDGIRLRPAK